MLPFVQMNLGRCLGNKLVIAVSLDLTEQDVGVGNRTHRIQRNAGGRVRGDLLNTIDVDLDRAVVVRVFDLCRCRVTLSHLSSSENSGFRNPHYRRRSALSIWTKAEEFILPSVIVGTVSKSGNTGALLGTGSFRLPE